MTECYLCGPVEACDCTEEEIRAALDFDRRLVAAIPVADPTGSTVDRINDGLIPAYPKGGDR